MQMTNGEIVKSYKEAKEKKKQIEILAQLNACPIANIREILISEGVQFPGPKPKKAEEKAEAPEEPKESKIPEESPKSESPKPPKAPIEVIIAVGTYRKSLEEKKKAMELQIKDIDYQIAILNDWLHDTK